MYPALESLGVVFPEQGTRQGSCLTEGCPWGLWSGGAGKQHLYNRGPDELVVQICQSPILTPTQLLLILVVCEHRPICLADSGAGQRHNF